MIRFCRDRLGARGILMGMSRLLNSPRPSQPAWDVAYLFPAQGAWDAEDYLALDTNRLIEFDSGVVEVLPMPTEEHQSIALYLYLALHAFAEKGRLGKVLIAPFPVQLWAGKFRQPDVMFMLKKNARKRNNRFWKGADLVMEIVSRSRKDRHRDLRTKREEYAKAGIAEYWIVDPSNESITLLALQGREYVEVGVFSGRSAVESRLLTGFSVPLHEVFNATE